MILTPKCRPVLARSLLISLAPLVLSGCVVNPEKISSNDVGKRVRADQEQIYKEQEALYEPITFSVALARALKYNLDYRLKLMESALSQGLFDVAEMDLLPKLVAEAGYTSRSNDSGGTSIGIEDRLVSLRPSTSEERSHQVSRAEFSWNALDFGISYYRAKQAADEFNIAEERRRKILQNIVQDVRNAFWRAMAAQRLVGEAETLLVRIREALDRSREAERAGVMPPTQALAYQRALLDAMTMVNVKRQEMDFAKRELAALMNVTPGTDFRLAESNETRLSPAPLNLGELELIALENRPELREEDYRARIGQNEARKQLVALFPSLNFFAGVRTDSNRYLYNSSWSDSGVNLSINLFKLASLPAIERTNEARAKADEARRLALSMAVITQVRVSAERYRLAVLDYELAAESTRVDQRLAAVSKAGSNNRLESELEALRTESRAIVSRFQQANAYAAAQASYGRIMNSIGIDLLPEKVRGVDIATLSKAIEEGLVEGEREAFLSAASEVPQYPSLQVKMATPPDGSTADGLRKAVEKVLVRNDMIVSSTDTSPALTMRFERTGGKDSGRAVWQLSLVAADGKPLLTTSYSSFLPRESGERTLSAFAEAAVLSALPKLREALLGSTPPQEKH